jgi:hypothetical protein
VVVERAATDLGLAEDFLGRGGSEPLLAEEPAPGRDEPTTGRLCAFCLRGHGVILSPLYKQIVGI